MRCGFLMCRRYAPFHKLLDREYHQLPGTAQTIAEYLDLSTQQPEKCSEAVPSVQELLIRWLGAEGLTSSPPDYRKVTWWDETLAQIGDDLRKSITDPEIRGLSAVV